MIVKEEKSEEKENKIQEKDDKQEMLVSMWRKGNPHAHLVGV